MKRSLFYTTSLFIFSAVITLSCSSGEDVLEPIDNQYTLDDSIFEIESSMYWEFSDVQGGVDEIRLLEPLPEGVLGDMIILKPVPGPADLEGIYTFSKTGAVGTYDLNFIHGIGPQGDFEWNTNGDFGQTLEISLVQIVEGNKIYRVILSDFTLNYGYWDYLAAKWVSMGQKSFQLSYQGPIMVN